MLAWALVATAVAVIVTVVSVVALVVARRRATAAAASATAALRATEERAERAERAVSTAETKVAELTAALAGADADRARIADELAVARDERDALERLLAVRTEDLCRVEGDLRDARAALAGLRAGLASADHPGEPVLRGSPGLWGLEVERARRRWREIVPVLPGETDEPADLAGPVAAQLGAVLRWTLERLREEAGTHTTLVGTAPDLGPGSAIEAAIVVEELATALARTADEVTVTLGATEHGWLAVTVTAPWEPGRRVPWPQHLVAGVARVGATLHLDEVVDGRAQARLFIAP